jgi:glycosyltransferase involved in cell wall biosynthesis
MDAIVLQKKLPTPADAWVWRRRRAPLLFDYDDAVMFRQFPRNGSHRSRTRARRFGRMLDLADAFVCGNDYLASFSRPSGKPLLVAPSPVPLDVPAARARPPGVPVRIGWLGSPVNLASLASLGPVLRRLGERHDFVLVVISEETLDLPGVPVQHVRWSADTQAREIAQLDVGLMPLVDSPWSRGKCAYKLLQYMAAGLPVVASAVGMNRAVVDPGRNGLLAVDEREWLEALEQLIESPEQAARLGRCARASVRERFGYERAAQAWCHFLERVIRISKGNRTSMASPALTSRRRAG